ncbi:MAG: cation:proton antiporter [Armatimonadota bacterium]|nr:cation:proton antiporter [Armatimonadota bacterium]
MQDIQSLLIQLFAIFVAAQVGSEIAVRLKLPSVVGEIAGGIAIGPHALGLFRIVDGHAPMPFEMLAEIGVVFLMFHVGLETQLSSLRRLGKLAVQVALLGVAVPFLLGMGWGYSMGYEVAKQAFIGTAFVATSVAITARVLTDLKSLQRKEARVILAAAVLDDILAMLLLGAVVALQPAALGTGPSPMVELLILAGQAIVFLLALTVFLPKLVRRHHKVIDAPANTNSPFVLSIVLCLGISVLAMQIGLAAIIGAFLAGTLLAEIGEQYHLERQLRPLLIFLSPFFFVVTGSKVDISIFNDPAMILSAIVVTLLAVVGKVVGCGFAARRMGKVSSLIVGVGMSPRGEVGIIIAALGLKEGIFEDDIYALIIAMSILTSVIAPPILASLLKRSPSDGTTPRAA